MIHRIFSRAKLLIPLPVVFSFLYQQGKCHSDTIEFENEIQNLYFTSWGFHRKKKKRSEKTPFDLSTTLEVALANGVDTVISNDGTLYYRRDDGWDSLDSELTFKSADAFQSSILACSDDGDVYFIDDENNIQQLDVPCFATKVFFGTGRVAVISDTGEVYMKGKNEFGQCGLGESFDIDEFTQIPSLYFDSPVVKIAFGSQHTLYLTEKGYLYSSGANDYMQLGLEYTKEKAWLANEDWFELAEMGAVKTIKLLERHIAQRPFYDNDTMELWPRICIGHYFNGKVLDMDAGDLHSVAIIKKGFNDPPRVFSWGACNEGQLGHRNRTNMSPPGPVSQIESFTEHDPEFNMTTTLTPSEISCGARHTLIRIEGPSSAVVFGCGSNQRNQISSANKKFIPHPKKMKVFMKQNVRPLRIWAGEDKSAAITLR